MKNRIIVCAVVLTFLGLKAVAQESGRAGIEEAGERTGVVQKIMEMEERLKDANLRNDASFFGSAQEFVKDRILGCFPEGDEFSLGRCHSLSFQQQVAQVLVAPATPQQGLDIPIDGFHHTHRDPRPAVVEDALQMIE